jgi:hypothetical protein
MPLKQQKTEFSETSSTEMGESQERRLRWYQIIARLLLVIFCVEVGVFLLVTPWLSWWEKNYFSSAIWLNSYFRGAVSGLGAVNIYIAFVELLWLRRAARS